MLDTLLSVFWMLVNAGIAVICLCAFIAGIFALVGEVAYGAGLLVNFIGRRLLRNLRMATDKR